MEIFSISNIVILSATLIVIIVYTIETYKLRNINASQLKLNLDLQEPDVIAYFDTGKIHGQLLFIVENVGGSSAYNIKAKFDREFDPAEDVFKRNMVDNSLFNDGLSDLPAKKHYILDAGLTPYIHGKSGEDKSKYQYSITIEFYNYRKIKFKKSYPINIEQFVFRATISDKSRIEEYLEGINNSLKTLVSNIN